MFTTNGIVEEYDMSRTKVGVVVLLAGSLLVLAVVPAFAQSNSGVFVSGVPGMMGMHGQVTRDDVDRTRGFQQQMPADLIDQMRARHAQMPDDMYKQMQSMPASRPSMHGAQAVENCLAVRAVATPSDHAVAP
jgi:Spy/CpxP family protein refolding chaperone